MAVILEHLTKRQQGHLLVNDVSLQIEDGECFVLLGSSGSGKGVLLQLIAGLMAVDGGRVLLHGRDITHLPPQARKIGYVFTDNTLFSEATVAENVEFALRIRGVAAVERRRRCTNLLELVGLAGLGQRLPHQLSSGQQQRVALARALAHQPQVLLLDDPLRALDARVRSELQHDLRSVQRALGITTLLVTNDQNEAFAVADRIGMMNLGRLVEVGAPIALYQQPQTEATASFLGTANLLVGQLAERTTSIGSCHFPLSAMQPTAQHEAERVQVLFRPEDVVLVKHPAELDCPTLGQGQVAQTIFAGSQERLRVCLPPIPGVRPITPPVAYGGRSFMIEATRPQSMARALPLAPGDPVWVGIKQIHTLAHVGLRFLVFTDGLTTEQAALAGQIARLAHARTTLLSCRSATVTLPRDLQEAKEQINSHLTSLEMRTSPKAPVAALQEELERQSYDLVILSTDSPDMIRLGEQVLQWGEQHLLFLPPKQVAYGQQTDKPLTGDPQVPARTLICVAGGEPGKEDVLFAGRLLRHFNSTATLLTVLPAMAHTLDTQTRAQRFLEDGVRTLQLMSVQASTRLRYGLAQQEILGELQTGAHDWLVLGAPLPDLHGNTSLRGVVADLLRQVNDHAVLIIRTLAQGGTSPLVSAPQATPYPGAVQNTLLQPVHA